MKKRTCIHPRKVRKVMKQFLNETCDLTYTYLADEPDTIAIKSDTITIELSKGRQFCAEGIDTVNDAVNGVLNIYYNLDQLSHKVTKIFRSYWTEKNPMLKGFSDVTLALLHELGHFETADEIRETFTFADRTLAMTAIRNNCHDLKSANYTYYKMPDETAATEWAINWLSNAENRKKAKAFEKKFFACFE